MLTKEQLFDIAKIVDNGYIGTEKTFTADRKSGYWYLTTNKCDDTSLIKVWGDDSGIRSITRLGEDTEGWDLIHPKTMERVMAYLIKIQESKNNNHE